MATAKLHIFIPVRVYESRGTHRKLADCRTILPRATIVTPKETPIVAQETIVTMNYSDPDKL